jgi:trigger factor
LAKQVGNYQTIDELKEAVKQDLIKKQEAQIRLNMEEQVLEYLLKENNFSVPASLVHKRFEYLLEQAKHKLEHQGFKKEEIEKENKSLEEKLKPEAEKQVKVYFLLNKIAETEDIKVTPQEREEKYHYLSQVYSKNIEEIKKEVNEHNLAEDLAEEILREKTIDFLVKEAKIIEEE